MNIKELFIDSFLFNVGIEKRTRFLRCMFDIAGENKDEFIILYNLVGPSECYKYNVSRQKVINAINTTNFDNYFIVLADEYNIRNNYHYIVFGEVFDEKDQQEWLLDNIETTYYTFHAKWSKISNWYIHDNSMIVGMTNYVEFKNYDDAFLYAIRFGYDVKYVGWT